MTEPVRKLFDEALAIDSYGVGFSCRAGKIYVHYPKRGLDGITEYGGGFPIDDPPIEPRNAIDTERMKLWEALRAADVTLINMDRQFAGHPPLKRTSLEDALVVCLEALDRIFRDKLFEKVLTHASTQHVAEEARGLALQALVTRGINPRVIAVLRDDPDDEHHREFAKM